MFRSKCNPLGNARKIMVTSGMVDGDRTVPGPVDVGYRYAWVKGLQPLLGKEGCDTYTHTHTQRTTRREEALYKS